jgi:trans-aconitate 2-methyltransferase
VTNRARDLPAEWNAAVNHRVSGPQVTWGGRVLERIPLAGGETVVDAGCGTGRLTADLLKSLPHGHVIAVDRPANMLAKAAAYLVPRFGDRVSFLHSKNRTATPPGPS